MPFHLFLIVSFGRAHTSEVLKYCYTGTGSMPQPDCVFPGRTNNCLPLISSSAEKLTLGINNCYLKTMSLVHLLNMRLRFNCGKRALILLQKRVLILLLLLAFSFSFFVLFHLLLSSSIIYSNKFLHRVMGSYSWITLLCRGRRGWSRGWLLQGLLVHLRCTLA